jgi:hypothetical protein
MERQREAMEKQAQNARTPAPVPAPTGPPSLKEQWKVAIKDYGQGLKQRATEAVTPAGFSRGVRTIGRKALEARDELSDSIRAHKALKIQEEADARQRRIDNWNNLSPEDRHTILETRAEQARLKEELRQKRITYDQYNSDRVIASMSGQKFFPKVYKVPGGDGIFGESSEKYVDEYGREVPGIPEELYKRRKAHTEQDDINTVLGGGGSGGRRRRSRYTDNGSEPEARPRRRSERDEVMDLFR